MNFHDLGFGPGFSPTTTKAQLTTTKKKQIDILCFINKFTYLNQWASGAPGRCAVGGASRPGASRVPPAGPGRGPCAPVCALAAWPQRVHGHSPVRRVAVARGDGCGTPAKRPGPRRASVCCEPLGSGCAKPPLRRPPRPSQTAVAAARGQARGGGGGTGRDAGVPRSRRPEGRGGAGAPRGGRARVRVAEARPRPAGTQGPQSSPASRHRRARGCAAPTAAPSLGRPRGLPRPHGPPARPRPASPRPEPSLACALARGPVAAAASRGLWPGSRRPGPAERGRALGPAPSPLRPPSLRLSPPAQGPGHPHLGAGAQSCCLQGAPTLCRSRTTMPWALISFLRSGSNKGSMLWCLNDIPWSCGIKNPPSALTFPPDDPKRRGQQGSNSVFQGDTARPRDRSLGSGGTRFSITPPWLWVQVRGGREGTSGGTAPPPRPAEPPRPAFPCVEAPV